MKRIIKFFTSALSVIFDIVYHCRLPIFLVLVLSLQIALFLKLFKLQPNFYSTFLVVAFILLLGIFSFLIILLTVFIIDKSQLKIQYYLSIIEGFFIFKKKNNLNYLKTIIFIKKSKRIKNYCLNYYKVKAAFKRSLYGRFGKSSQSALNHSLYDACTKGSINEVRYLLTSLELKKHANIHAVIHNATIFEHACGVGHLDIVKYLFSSNQLKEHANLHSNNDYAIVQACRNGHLDIMSYFIFDLNIEKSTPIKEYLDSSPPLGVNELFEARKMQQELEKELQYNYQKYKRIKL
jgi:hypothetical protein